MKIPLRSSFPLRLATVCAGASLFCGGLLQAASLPNRLSADAAGTAPQPLPRAVSARIQDSTNLGHLRGDTPMQTMSLVLAPSAAQSAALDQLLAAQQDPTSAQYHQWLTPEQFGQRFGVSDSDLAVLQNWLTSQGLQVESVARSRNQITFSGTASTVEAAFHTELDRFSRHGQDFFENSTAPQVPSAFQGVVTSVTGLSSYRLQPQVRSVRAMASQAMSGATPNYTSSGGNHYIAPSDWRTIYNASPLYSSGYNGTGIKIAVLGQTAVNTTQITYFQQLTGQPTKLPTMVLVPNSGTSTVYQGDETESEADLEVASGVAPGATVLFVYTGSSSTTGVFGALDYTITNNLAPIITLSYGGCEVEQTSAFLSGQEVYLRQANAQGQTFVASSGDSGAAACDANDASTSYEGLQVNYPASSIYTTGVGGTQFADTGNGSAYWSSSNNSVGGSALGYIPESVWNESSVSPISLASGGGGFSRMFGKPNWQTGTGVPADGARDVPDISFSAAGHDAYLFCTADPSYSSSSGGSTVTGACTTTSFGSLSVVAGTSLSTPSFAGALAIVESARGGTALGNINRLLYSVAASTPSVFHDITTGSNVVPCVSGSLGCVNGTLGYSATAGYDLASGLGSMDINAFSNSLATALTATAKTPTVSITPGTATTASITVNLAVTAGTTASATPSGTVTVTLDGGTPQTVTLTSGTATATFSSTGGYSVGTHTVAATYAGDTNYGTATSSLRVTVSATNSGLSLAVTPTTLTINSSTAHSGVYTLAATSTNGYAGVVYIYATGGPSSGCFLGSDASVAANGTISIPITYSFLASDCTSSSATSANRVLPRAALSAPTGLRPAGSVRLPIAALAFTGLFGMACIRRRRAAWNAWMTGLLALTCLVGTAALSGCGSGSAPLSQTTTTGTGTTTGSTVKGTYSVKFTITDYTGTISSSQTVSLVIQ